MPEPTIGTPIAGFKMKLYRAPIANTDVWVEVGGVQSVSVDDVAREEIEVAMRGSSWKRIIPGMMEAIGATFKQVHNVAPAMEAMIRADVLNGTPAKYAMVNGDITVSGTQGWVIPVYTTQMNRSEENSEVVANDIKVKLGYIINGTALVEPEWLIVA